MDFQKNYRNACSHRDRPPAEHTHFGSHVLDLWLSVKEKYFDWDLWPFIFFLSGDIKQHIRPELFDMTIAWTWRAGDIMSFS